MTKIVWLFALNTPQKLVVPFLFLNPVMWSANDCE